MVVVGVTDLYVYMEKITSKKKKTSISSTSSGVTIKIKIQHRIASVPCRKNKYMLFLLPGNFGSLFLQLFLLLYWLFVLLLVILPTLFVFHMPQITPAAVSFVSVSKYLASNPAIKNLALIAKLRPSILHQIFFTLTL